MDKVTSLGGYIEAIAELRRARMRTTRALTVSSQSVFRGQASDQWTLEPKLYREGLFDYESAMIQDALRLAPDEFERLDRFDVLAKLQHYGLPTRLLDATLNPLVALYFACHHGGADSSQQHDGVVFAFINEPTMNSASNVHVTMTMRYVFDYYTPALFSPSDFLKTLSDLRPHIRHVSVPSTTKDLNHIFTIPYMAVLPSLSNQRLRAQNGAFLLFGMQDLGVIVTKYNPGTFEEHFIKYGPVRDVEDTTTGSRIVRIMVDRTRKGQILEELDYVGVNEKALFPEVENQLRYVHQDYITYSNRSRTPEEG